MTPENNDPRQDKILWSSVSRNDKILVEVGDDAFNGAVSQTAKAILAKKNTPGWEYHTMKVRDGLLGSRLKTATSKDSTLSSQKVKSNVPKLKAVKFHVYEHHNNDWDLEQELDSHEPIVWVFAAVYNPEATTWEHSDNILEVIKSFIQKIICLTSIPRLSEPEWRQGSTLSCQRSFGCTLLQCMEDVTYLGKMAMVNQSLQDTINMMQSNISAILDQENQLRDIKETTHKLDWMAASFKKKTKGIRRRMMMQNAKHGLVMGSVVTTVVGICVIPPLIVVL